MFVRNPSTFEKAFNESHALKYLLFLEASSDDLHANGKTMHVVGVVAPVCIRFDLVSRPERRREDVELAVDTRDGHDTRRVVKLESSQTPHVQTTKMVMIPTTLNRNVYPHDFHWYLLCPCLIAGSALGTVSTKSSFSCCQYSNHRMR